MRVTKVENGGLLFTDNPAGVSGTDCGYSLPIGRETLWFLGDMFLLDPTAPERRYVGGVSNGALLVPKGSGTEPLRRYRFLTEKNGRARQVIPLLSGENDTIRLWPFGGWFSPAGAGQPPLAYLYYAVVQTNGSGPLDFRTLGHGLARADVSRPDTLQFTRLPGSSGPHRLWWNGDDTGSAALFGAAVVGDKPNAAARNDFLYLVGTQTRSGKKFAKLARVGPKQIETVGEYDYFAGGEGVNARWSRNIADAADVDGLTDFPSELSISYNAYLGAYLAVHSVGLTEKARLSTAPHPWGPYTLLGEIGTPHQAFAKAFCYAGKEHPELAEQNGRIVYLTYVDNQHYWLQLLKVTLQK